MRREDIEIAIINKDRAAKFGAKIKEIKNFHYFYNNLFMKGEKYIRHFSQKPQGEEVTWEI